MIVQVDRSFQKDLKKIKNKSLDRKVADCIESVQKAKSLGDIKSLNKLKGSDHYYRIRIGDYRLGLEIENETVIFIRCLHRKEVYQHFPK